MGNYIKHVVKKTSDLHIHLMSMHYRPCNSGKYYRQEDVRIPILRMSSLLFRVSATIAEQGCTHYNCMVTYYAHVRCIDIVKNLKWTNVIQRRDYFVALSVFKCIHGMSPSYLSDCITMYNEIAVSDTRASTYSNLVIVPNAHLALFGNYFAYRGPVTWNALPEHNIVLLESAIISIRLRKLCEHLS